MTKKCDNILLNEQTLESLIYFLTKSDVISRVRTD